MKKIVLALAFVLLGSFMLFGCSKDEILDHYNNIVQSAGSIELTGKSSLQGEKEKGIDDYTGTYTADYANFSGTEYLFGGTSIKREAGKELSIDCTLEITEGTAKVFWISGSDEAVTFSRAYETAVLIFRAAVSLRLHKPMMNFLEILFSSYPISL